MRNVTTNVASVVWLFFTAAASYAQTAEEPVRAYLNCAKTAVTTIDDRVSDAATVALGLHAQCRMALVDVGLSTDRQSNLAEVLRPSLVQYVLLSRAAMARSTDLAKPVKPKANL